MCNCVSKQCQQNRTAPCWKKEFIFSANLALIHHNRVRTYILCDAMQLKGNSIKSNFIAPCVCVQHQTSQMNSKVHKSNEKSKVKEGKKHINKHAFKHVTLMWVFVCAAYTICATNKWKSVIYTAIPIYISISKWIIPSHLWHNNK